jgi:hypothetical protein
LFQNGQNVELQSFGAEIKANGLMIGYRPPFHKMPDGLGARTMPETVKYTAAVLQRRNPKDEPYGIDIWAPKKVLPVVWHHGSKPVVVSHKPGEWEGRLEALAGGETSTGT